MSLVAHVAFFAFFNDFHLVGYAYSAQPTYILWHAFISTICAVHTEPFSVINKAGVTHAPFRRLLLLLQTTHTFRGDLLCLEQRVKLA